MSDQEQPTTEPAEELPPPDATLASDPTEEERTAGVVEENADAPKGDA